MWETAFADYSSAAPWLGGGFIAGLLAFALVRAAIGGNSRAAAEEIAKLQDLVVQRQASLDQAAMHLATARDEAEAQRSAAQYLEDEYGRLAAKHDASFASTYLELSRVNQLAAELTDRLNAQSAAHAAEISQLKSHMSAASQGIDPELYEVEVASLLDTIKELRAEMAAMPQQGIDPELYESEVSALIDTIKELRTELATAPQKGIDPELYESEVSALLSTVHDLRTELAASEGAISQVRAALNH